MPADLREIITVEQFTTALIALAVVLPLLGLALGKKCFGSSTRGLTAGLIGPGILVMWFIYQAITAKLGLDRVINLVVNGVLFVSVGAIVGWAVAAKGRSAVSTASGQPEIDS